MQHADSQMRPPVTVFTVISVIWAATANLVTEYAMMNERVKASRTTD